jgi:hypothetical protein
VVSAAPAISAELVMATVELELPMALAAMARVTIRPESQRDATAATGKGITRREPRPGIRFIGLLPVRKAEPVPSSLLGRQGIPVATTFHEINPALASRANPASNNALAQRQRVQPGPAALGRDTMQQTNIGSTRKQRNDYVTGRAEHLDGTTQNVIITITGVIVIIMITIGGIVIATLSCLLAEVFGAGMTGGGIRPGAMTHIILIMIITPRSMAMTAYNQTR